MIADDDPNVREIIRLYFKQHQMEVMEASDGESALALAAESQPDIAILDVMMPGMDGFETCREMLKRYDFPVIMLTAKGDEFDRVLGLELGADDYITKPFSPRELVARIKAVFRRMQKSRAPQDHGAALVLYEFDGLTIHLDRREVMAGGERIALRPKEFDLLAYMAKSPGSVYTRDQLLERVWGYDFLGDMRTVDVHVKKLREKLLPWRSDCIHTVWGVGYKFEAAPCS